MTKTLRSEHLAMIVDVLDGPMKRVEISIELRAELAHVKKCYDFCKKDTPKLDTSELIRRAKRMWLAAYIRDNTEN